MDVLHPQKPPQSPSSILNPDAPIFVPMKSYQTVEDFSDQWWDLVHSNPFFRDYWLQDCFDDGVDDDVFDDNFFASDDDFFFPDFDAFSDIFLQKQEEKMKEEEEKKKEEKAKAELITMAALKWNGCNGKVMEACRTFEKVPKVVKSVKVSPRSIHQPR